MGGSGAFEDRAAPERQSERLSRSVGPAVDCPCARGFRCRISQHVALNLEAQLAMFHLQAASMMHRTSLGSCKSGEETRDDAKLSLPRLP